MQKRTREIAALVLLVMLGIGAAFAMGWYVLVGHNWNVTASNIDDSVGQMNGYEVILFEGTHPVKATARDGAASRGSLPSSAGSERAGGSAQGQDAPAADGGKDGAPTLDEVRESYIEKGATVFLLDTGNPDLYGDPLVVSKGGRRIGFCEVDEPARIAEARVDIKLLKRRKTDFNVMLTNDGALPDVPIRGVDVMVCTASGGEPGRCRQVGYTYCVDAPYQGEVQAVIVSPSGVVSSKTIESL